MDHNPWWHGYFRKVYVDKKLCNYVGAYIFETRLANCKLTGGNPQKVRGVDDYIKRELYDQINAIPWTEKNTEGKIMYSKAPTARQKRAFVWGMAVHRELMTRIEVAEL